MISLAYMSFLNSSKFISLRGQTQGFLKDEPLEGAPPAAPEPLERFFNR